MSSLLSASARVLDILLAQAKLHQRLLLRPHLAAALAISATLISGCGPGVGGTGTGSVSEAMAAFGAQPSTACPLCAAATTAPNDPLPQRYVEPAQRRITADFQGVSVALNDICAQRRFVGDWGVPASAAGAPPTPTLPGRYFGVYAERGQTEGIAAALQVMRQPDGSLLIELRDVYERSLLDSARLSPLGTTELPPTRCP